MSQVPEHFCTLGVDKSDGTKIQKHFGASTTPALQGMRNGTLAFIDVTM